MNKTLTLTTVIDAASLNYGEGSGNYAEIKKFHRADGNAYTFASRQSIRYDIIRLGNELFGWNLKTVDQAKGVVQFRDDVSIADSVEMDLFGYMKTGKETDKRSAVVRLSHAIALEPYRSDLDYLNNMGLAQRGGKNGEKLTNALVQIEHHQSLYTYTITIDLNRIGIDEVSGLKLPNPQREERVTQLLEILKILNRDIRGRRENLSPIFVIGGVYDVSNPFFQGKMKLKKTPNGMQVDDLPLASLSDMTFMGKAIGKATQIGQIEGVLAKNDALESSFEGRISSIENFFQHMKTEVTNYYAG